MPRSPRTAASACGSRRPDYTALFVEQGVRYTSAPVRVYADYYPRVGWRHRSHGRIQAGMVLSVTARVIDSYTGKKVVFYGYRRKHAHAARRLFTTRIFYTRDSSSGRPAAYALRRVKRARRIHYVFACLPEPRPNSFGRPDDPLVRQCGRARVSWT